MTEGLESIIEDQKFGDQDKNIMEWQPSIKNRISNLNDLEIQLIAEHAINEIKDKLNAKESSSEVLENFFKILKSKKKVIKQKEFSIGVRIGGYIMLGLCIWYWIFFFFIVQDFEPLTYTTYLTLILISMTCIKKFESALLNSFTCITVYGFFVITLWFIPVSRDFDSLCTGPILHGVMACFQLYLVLHRKVAISKRYIIFGFLFYLIFLSNYDTFSRLTLITETQHLFPVMMTVVHSFYGLAISCVVIYFYKKRYGTVLP
ncbi:MAG: hypothetical protein ACFFAN_01225 [Promethearchaeota archaeon]